MTQFLTQYDDVNLSLIPKDAQAVAAYAGGTYENFQEAMAEFPHAKHKSIAVRADEDAEILDVESGDAVPSEAPAWIDRQLKRGVKKPGVYADASNMPLVLSALNRAGIKREDYVVWVADYTYVKPEYPFQQDADAVQYTDRALGESLDASICTENFWYEKPAPVYHNNIPYKDFPLTPRRTPWGLKSERRTVKKYDALRIAPTTHEAELKQVEKELAWFAHRIWILVHKDLKKNHKPNWHRYHRGVRYQQLVHRAINHWRFK